MIGIALYNCHKCIYNNEMISCCDPLSSLLHVLCHIQDVTNIFDVVCLQIYFVRQQNGTFQIPKTNMIYVATYTFCL